VNCLLFKDLANSFWGVNDDPVVPSNTDFENIAVFLGPFAKDCCRFRGELVADSDERIAFGTRDGVESTILKKPSKYCSCNSK
jgi:hypothetical protein